MAGQVAWRLDHMALPHCPFHSHSPSHRAERHFTSASVTGANVLPTTMNPTETVWLAAAGVFREKVGKARDTAQPEASTSLRSHTTCGGEGNRLVTTY